MTALSFRVYGTPAPAGSKTVVPTKAGPRVVDGGSAPARQSRATWRQDVVAAAAQAIEAQEWEKLTGPVYLHVELIVPRPKGTPERRRDGARYRPTKRPDLTKLLRATEDALTVAGVWADDSLVVQLVARKRYPIGGERPGARIIVDLEAA